MALPVNVLVISRTGTSIVEIPGVHVYDNERHRATRTVTQYPVESGAEIVDHAIRQPMEVTLRGFVSSSPVGQGRQGAIPDPNTDPLDQARQQRLANRLLPRRAFGNLLRFLDNSEVVSITTNLGRYQNMVLESVETDQNADTGENLAFEARFRELQYASELTGLSEVTISATTGPAAARAPTQRGGYGAADPVSVPSPGSPIDLTLSSPTVSGNQLTPSGLDQLRECYVDGDLPSVIYTIDIKRKSFNDTEFTVNLEGVDVEIRLRWNQVPPVPYWTFSMDVGSRRIVRNWVINPCTPLLNPGNGSGLSGNFYVVKLRDIAGGTRGNVPESVFEDAVNVLPRFAWGRTPSGLGEYGLFYVPRAGYTLIGSEALP